VPVAKTIAAAANRKPFENEPLVQACTVAFILCNAAIIGSLFLFFFAYSVIPIFGSFGDAIKGSFFCTTLPHRNFNRNTGFFYIQVMQLNHPLIASLSPPANPMI